MFNAGKGTLINLSSVEVHLALPIGTDIPIRDLISSIERAEVAGFEGIACGEFADISSAAFLGAVSRVTKSIRLTTSVIAVSSRSPALLAMTASTLSELSDGRFALGLGIGSPMVSAYHGHAFNDPVGTMARTIVDVRSALEGESLVEWGRFRLRHLQRVNVPIYIAAMNPRMMRLAGQLADGIILNLSGPIQVAEHITAAFQARGDEATTSWKTFVPLWVNASSDEQRARDQFKTDMAPYLAVPTYRRAMVALSDEDAVDRGASIWSEQGRSSAAQAFPDTIVDAVLVSDPVVFAQRLLELHEAGASDVIATPVINDRTKVDEIDAAIDFVARARQ
jgi:alkanesulfonate monooxygenase SsuD/methylene tetrahydromethanopterin reductase-like flavin-dependent oxidoreductase (luciferase family)